jgi:hypothetical protein
MSLPRQYTFRWWNSYKALPTIDQTDISGETFFVATAQPVMDTAH